MQENKRPLIVELDNVLVPTSTTVEACLLYLKRFPLRIFKLIYWLFQGVSKLKEKLSDAIPNPKTLPYQNAVLEHISDARDSNRRIYLISGANQEIVDAVAEELEIFDLGIGLGNKQEINGLAKLEALRKYKDIQEFDYIGGSRNDLQLFKESHTAAVCTNSSRTIKKIRSVKSDGEIIELEHSNTNSIRYWIKALRIYQWAKNSLLFLALFMSHRILETEPLLNSIFAFLSFSFIASSVYILNDLFDLEDDRRHPTKKERPFASGKISASKGLVAGPLLIVAGFVLSLLQLPYAHTIALFSYLIATTAYSLYFKEILFVDVILLGSLYTLRILAGGFATGIEVSSWLLGFSGFFFLSLAFMKRYTDLMLFKQNSQEELFGRGYSVSDTDFVQKAGIASAFVSLLILALYITGDQVLLLYNRPELLWLTIPLILYWLMNMWYNTSKGKMTDDPIIFAIKDKTSYIVFLLVLAIIVTATIL